MNTTTHSLVQKLWNYCSVLRDDGMSYGDYVEQLTYLLFLKMADERSQPPYNQTSIVPAAYAWPTLLGRDGDDLFDHYRHALEKLGQEKGTLGLIFAKAQNKFQDPAKLRRVIVDLIDAETWTVLGADVKGDAYEGLLEKNAQDTKSGAGQYFTPRALIAAMVECIDPKPAERVCDPACGTGGFLFSAHQHVVDHHPNLTKDEKKHLKESAFVGFELVQATARVCAMNLLLHGIGSEKSVPVRVGDALGADPGDRFEVVLANPPFGKKSSTVIVGEDGRTSTEKDTIERDDFWATTSNKQLNFVQHIKTLLAIHGRAAVVLPDNVLFEGGAGETIRKKLLHECDLHTLLRLPTAADIHQRLRFFNVGPTQNPAVIAAHLNGKGLAGANFDEMVLLVNVDTRSHTVADSTLQGKPYQLHPVHLDPAAVDTRPVQLARHDAASGRFEVPARTALVYVLTAGASGATPTDPQK